MIATGLLVLFLFINAFFKRNGLKMVKKGMVQGLFIILMAKMLFWFTIVELVYIWWKDALIFVLPLVFVLFFLYLFLDRRIFIRTLKLRRKNRGLV